MITKIINRIIKLLGGYTKDEVLTEAVKELFNTIGPDDILREEAGIWMAGNKALTSGEIKLIITEAKHFLSTKLWKVLQNDIKYQANKSMFEKSRNELDITAGKLWLYTLDSFKTRLKSLSEEKGRFNIN